MPTFTKATVEKLAGKREDALHFDDKTPGFFMRTYKSGAPAVFGVKYSVSGKQRRMNLGPAAADNVDTMRDLAETVRAKAKLGEDTLGQQKAARASARAAAAPAVTLGRLVERYLGQRKADLRPRSYAAAKMYLTQHWKPLHGKALDAIKRADAVGVIDDIAEKRGKVAADRARTALSTFYMWAIDKGYVDTTPMLHIKDRDTGESRARVLTEAELVNVWNDSEPDDFGRITRLLILTGCRKREIAELRWPEIDFDKRQVLLPKERVKNKREFILPLSEQALEILLKCPAVAERERVFSDFSWSRYKDELDERLPEGMEPWVLHDLRRSFVTHMADNGLAPPHIIEACVNHASGHQGGVAGVYNRASYLPEKRQAFDVWGRFIEDLVAGRRGKVVALRKGAA